MSVPQPVQSPPPNIVPYYPPPSYPPPASAITQALDSRAVVAIVLAVLGLVLGLLLPVGVPGLVFGPIAYFTGKSAVRRIDASAGALGGRNFATTAWILGIVATAAGAVLTLIWLVVLLLAISTPAS